MRKKESRFKTVVFPLIFVTFFSAGLGMAIEEFLASEGDYRVTIWDRLNGRGELPKGRAEVSKQVAIQVCKQRAIEDLGRGMLQAKYDDRSSRYSDEKKVHTIFMDLVVKDAERDVIYIRCDVSAVNRVILESRIKGRTGFSLF